MPAETKNKQVISKILSANDTGETGAHQAGIHIPKKPEILGFFPNLDKSDKNPRQRLQFYDEDDAGWKFTFIYYNNKYFGGTRNEFRLTGTTKFFREKNLKCGDKLFLEHEEENKKYTIRYSKNRSGGKRSDGVLVVSAWKAGM